MGFEPAAFSSPPPRWTLLDHILTTGLHEGGDLLVEPGVQTRPGGSQEEPEGHTGPRIWSGYQEVNLLRWNEFNQLFKYLLTDFGQKIKTLVFL